MSLEDLRIVIEIINKINAGGKFDIDELTLGQMLIWEELLKIN